MLDQLWRVRPIVEDEAQRLRRIQGAERVSKIIISFEPLDDGTLVALHTHEGRSVAAIVHPRHSLDGGNRRWSLAGDIGDRAARPRGTCNSLSSACAEAAEALGIELGIDVVGYEVTR